MFAQVDTRQYRIQTAFHVTVRLSRLFNELPVTVTCNHRYSYVTLTVSHTNILYLANCQGTAQVFTAPAGPTLALPLQCSKRDLDVMASVTDHFIANLPLNVAV